MPNRPGEGAVRLRRFGDTINTKRRDRRRQIKAGMMTDGSPRYMIALCAVGGRFLRHRVGAVPYSLLIGCPH